MMGDYCEVCSPGCDDCTSWDNCTSCGLGFVQIAGYCEYCHDTCIECQPYDIYECTKCRRGLTLEDDGTCVHRCDRGCFECQKGNSTNCYECYEGFALRSSG